MSDGWKENVSQELTDLIALADRYHGAARTDACGWMAGTQRAADAHDSLREEFARKCHQRPAVVAEGLLRLRDAIRAAAVPNDPPSSHGP